MKRNVLITGSTGVMGQATLAQLAERLDRFNIRLLVRESKKNRRILKRYLGREGIEVVYGDLLDRDSIERAVEGVDIVLHIGGLVSPMADHQPQKALDVNVGAVRNLIAAIKRQHEEAALVYIGSVAQTSDRRPPYHWGRTGDPLVASIFDYYGVSKIIAEREVAESGLKRWVSLRQSGILHPGLFLRGSDPITFHVPLKGVLEWATVEDSGRLMANICEREVPEEFWNNFYNIGSGETYRLTNYEFEKLILEAIGSPAPEKIFDTDWFATRNFHGCWFSDSDRLEKLVPFRENLDVKSYFRRMVKRAPLWARLAPLAPAPVVKNMMRRVAKTPGLGTLDWIGREDCEQKIEAFFGGRGEQERISGWADTDLTPPSKEERRLDHGYDETKGESRLTLEDMKGAALFRGGECLSSGMKEGDMSTPLRWRCAFGHEFEMTPRAVLKGGHWCPRCLPAPWRYNEEARRNPFLAQVWHNTHSPTETTVYDDGLDIRIP